MCLFSGVDLKAEQDIEQLRKVALVQQSQIEHLIRTLSKKCAELEHLKGSEGELQQTLALMEELASQLQTPPVEPKAKDAPKRASQRGHGPTEQTELDEVTQTFLLDEADLTCPSCGGDLSAWEGQHESSEMVDVVQVSYRLVKVQRQKYRCACGGCVETAPGPERTLEGGRYSLQFGVKVVEDKYLDHTPLQRQCRILKRRGVKVTSQTLWDLVWAISQELKPAWEKLRETILSLSVIGLDQTGWKRLHKGARDKTPWQMWCLTAPGLVYHRICEDKSAATFTELLGDYEGIVICDALSTHEAGARAGPGILLAGCWAHVLRKFRDSWVDFPQAKEAMHLIGQLYLIDSAAENDEQRAKLRDGVSRLVAKDLKKWLIKQRAPKTTSFGNAVRYTLTQWEPLTRFLDDPLVFLDNNTTERALRGPVVGRKNHYGSKSVRGTEAAAILYSLLETAKLQGVDPGAYLVEAVRAARRGEVLLPADLRA